MKIYNKSELKIKNFTSASVYITGSNILPGLNEIEELKSKNYSKFLLLSDKNVVNHYGKRVLSAISKLDKGVAISIIPPGEKSKNLSQVTEILIPFFKSGLDRNTCLIALGGGVVTDMGGFIASCLLRGISLINIPTTLLGMVDAAVGGKTGVNIWTSENTMYKNMIGTYKQPDLVLSDIDVLETLPAEEFLNGIGEIVKYWVGWGKPKIEQLLMIKKMIKTPPRWQADPELVEGEAMTPRMVEELVKTISICQHIKFDVITTDPYETEGERQKLNLGHTIGHAIEGLSRGKLSHGQAVAIGLITIAKISVLKKLLKPETFLLIKHTIANLGLPAGYSDLNCKNILNAMKFDKKGGKFVLIEDIGKLKTGVIVEEKIINQVVESLLQ